MDEGCGKKCSSYHEYDKETRGKARSRDVLRNMEQLRMWNGPDVLGHTTSQTMVQSIEKQYKRKLALLKDPSAIKALTCSKRTRPLLLNSKVNNHVQVYIHAMCDAGGGVNRKLII